MIEKKKAKTNYPLIPEIENRWSPRAFGEKKVEDEKLLKIFEAARWAPSSRNEQPWRFMVALKGEPHYEKMFEGFNEFNQKWAWTAPVIGVTLAAKKHAYKGRENVYRQHDVGLAMGSLLAQATHEGLHMHQMAGIDKGKIEENFNIDTAEYEVVAMFALGYQDERRLEQMEEKYRESEYKPRERKALDELIFGDGLGATPSWLK